MTPPARAPSIRCTTSLARSAERSHKLPKEKYRREIDEILEQVELPGDPGKSRDRERIAVPARLRMTRSLKPGAVRRGAPRITRTTSGRLFGAALVVLIVGIVVRPLFVPLAIVALGLVAWGYYLVLSKPRRPVISWRSRSEVTELSETWSSKLRRWLGRK